MQEILWDVLRAEALAHQLVNGDTTRTKNLADENGRLVKNVFLIHNITEEQYQKSYSYYTQHPDKLKNILDSLNAQQVRKSIVDTTPTLRKPLKYEGSR